MMRDIGRELASGERAEAELSAFISRRDEQRRGVLPRLIQAAKIKRLELQLRDREREAEGLREGLERLYEAFQAKEDELRQAKEARDAAHGQWAIRLSAVQGAEGRAERKARELDELREAGR
jgi:hypothetical protein